MVSHEWTAAPDGSHHVYAQPLEIPLNDERKYRLVRLNNQLEALIISDPETDRASAALDVHVGNFCDPEHLLGLAHFCEHLLFMGTEKYPKENDYYAYLSEHSGYANAWTSSQNTNYYFEVGHQWLDGALDRFAHFFIDPLFLNSCTEREIRAVDSEHKKNLQSDSWRVAQVEKTLSNKAHPWHKFETGNLETLMESPKRQGLDIRDELLRFHSNYYSANIMKLCVLGRESLDELTQWVVEKFSAVRNKDISLPSFSGHPLMKDQLKKQIFVKSVKHTRSLDITFPFPGQSQYFESQPANYISHLIGHEASGSILSFLKKKGWATNLGSGCSYERDFGFYHAWIELTESGLDNYEQVVVAFFQYIEMLKTNGVKKWIFDEVQSLAEIDFKFAEKCAPSNYTSWLVQNMQVGYPPSMVISGSTRLRSFDPELVQHHIDLLQKDNFRITLSAQDFPEHISLNQVEPWYKTEYEVTPFSAKLEEALAAVTPTDDFALPMPNDFLPRELNVDKITVDEKQKQPDLIQETATLRLWHKKDDTFWIPKTSAWLNLRSPLLHATPRHTVIAELYSRLLGDSLNEYAYNAEVAGLSYYIGYDFRGFFLNVSGYSEKLPLLLEKVVDRMKHVQLQPDRFAVIKEQAVRDYNNFHLEAPFQHAAYYTSYALLEHMWKIDDLRTELADVTLQDVQTTFPLFLTHLHLEALVHGDMSADQSIALLKNVEAMLEPRPLSPSQFISNRSVLLPPGKLYVHQLAVTDLKEVNSAVEFYIQVCDCTDVALRTRLSLISQIAQEPCFNQLRTKEQLGYIVLSGVRSHVGSMGLRVIIQSERDTVYLEARILDFLELTLHQMLADMSDDEFKSQVDSLVAVKTERHQNMAQEGSKYWSAIESQYFEFDDVEKDVEELKSITKQSMIDFYAKYIHPQSPEFRKFSMHLQSQVPPSATAAAANAETTASANNDDAPTIASDANASATESPASVVSLASSSTCSDDDVGTTTTTTSSTSSVSPKPPSLTSLHGCLTATAYAKDITYDQLERAVGKDLEQGVPTMVILRKLLVDELKTNEDQVEQLLTDLAQQLNTLSSKDAAEKDDNGTHINSLRDHTKLPDGTIIVTDLLQFKKMMPLSTAAVPFFLFSRI
ncbi:Metalloenzyme, LuxS/M16 peptidase-like protein [Gongronella butleri]|nr:Metalloenzyme, LuxS/M16 peptidase-like protein [Gongronella butleri]